MIEWKDIRRNIVLLIVLCLLGLGFLIFVWPTPFLIVRDARGQVYRVNRFTGVREEATAKGWRTKEQIDAEYWSQQAREQEARQQKEADDKADQQRKLDQIFADLKRIKVNSGRSELDRLILSNPTSWDLQGSSYNTTVEYFTRHKSSEEFLAKTQTTNSFLKAYSLNDFKLQEGTADLPSEVSSLPPGTAFLEKIFIQFDRATNRDTGETVWLKPAFVWKHERSWNIPQLDEP